MGSELIAIDPVCAEVFSNTAVFPTAATSSIATSSHWFLGAKPPKRYKGASNCRAPVLGEQVEGREGGRVDAVNGVQGVGLEEG